MPPATRAPANCTVHARGRTANLSRAGAQLALADLDQDGAPEVLNALDVLPKPTARRRRRARHHHLRARRLASREGANSRSHRRARFGGVSPRRRRLRGSRHRHGRRAVDRPMITRRALAGLAAFATTVGSRRERAAALGRIPMEGKIAMTLPWPLDRVDPHDLTDPGAALFGHALFDELYALEPAGEPFPTLAADAPTVEGSRTVIRLREGLTTAEGERLDARDALFSLQRARKGAAAAWWGDLPVPGAPSEGSARAHFRDARCTAHRAHPLLPLVRARRAYVRPGAPRRHGRDVAQPGPSRLVLRRNPNAARGPAFLEEVVDRSGCRPLVVAPVLRRQADRSRLARFGAARRAPRCTAFRLGERRVDRAANRRRSGTLGGAGRRAAPSRRPGARTVPALRPGSDAGTVGERRMGRPSLRASRARGIRVHG